MQPLENSDAAPADDAHLETAQEAERQTAAGYGAAQVLLRADKAGTIPARHPWVFASAIQRIEGDPSDGQVVDVLTAKRRFLGRGILNRRSQLAVRLYTWNSQEPLDDGFWRRRLEQAIHWRARLGYDDPDGAARLVFGEADGLSGLIVDRYGRHLVVQLNSLAMTVRLELLTALLSELLQPASITVRSEGLVARQEGIDPPQGLCWGYLPNGLVFITEHGLRYGVDLLTGQKTGFYLDQRENRRAAASLLAGRRVLDLFCFTGSFSLAAARLGHAREVLGLDSSAKAIAMARENAALNAIANVHFYEQDCFAALDELQQRGERFDAVILDPPKFTRSKQSQHAALQAYHRINRVAVELLHPDGILVTCSCSGNIAREDFLAMLSGVSYKSRRAIQVLEQRGAAPDHPVSPTCPESEYLKCMICRVL
jgi:23S rRNA (cytosine1962-C5)-methyltransferase